MKILSYSELLINKENTPLTYQTLLLTEEWKYKREQIVNRDFKRCSKCKLTETGSFAHYDEKTNVYDYITTDGEEYIRDVMDKNGNISEQSVPTIIIVHKPYHLEVHHKYYIQNNLPWDYDDSALITLCNWCHSETHLNEKIIMYNDNNKNSFRELIACDRCDGTGCISMYSHVKGGICFKCNGKRFKTELIK